MAYQHQAAVTAPFFSTPANVQDFQNPANYQGWSNWINETTNEQIAALQEVYNQLPPAQLQYINPSTYSASAAQYITKSVTWNSFPKRVSNGAVPTQAELAATDPPQKNDDKSNYFYRYYAQSPVLFPYLGRVQDEYCEWLVQRDPSSGKITQVDFTAEGPEYWQFLYDNEPDTLLKLYQQLSHPPAGTTITLEDLTLPHNQTYNGSRYNPNNIYNTTYGCVHLNCPPNSLGAEVNLAALATVLRQDENGVQITDPVQLTKCSGFGVPTRNSDPTIGSFVNQLATLQFMITLNNPVGLYLVNFDTSAWTDPSGKGFSQDQISQIVRLVRGHATPGQPGFGLHYTVSVPASFGYTLGDILIAGQPIQYGGQIAYSSITVGLTGAATTVGQPASEAPLLPCGAVQKAPDHGIAAAVGKVEEAVEKVLHIKPHPHLYASAPHIKPIPKTIPKTRVFND